jgi:hypothetical protein
MFHREPVRVMGKAYRNHQGAGVLVKSGAGAPPGNLEGRKPEEITGTEEAYKEETGRQFAAFQRRMVPAGINPPGKGDASQKIPDFHGFAASI